uniref:Uncharacterized protein n=1 Tax=Arundo donax TaxID=35708 RepID=A0A0A9C9H2_ARUDO
MCAVSSKEGGGRRSCNCFQWTLN